MIEKEAAALEGGGSFLTVIRVVSSPRAVHARNPFRRGRAGARPLLAFYDALILAAALEAGCETLYSEDFQPGRRFGDLTVINPFV